MKSLLASFLVILTLFGAQPFPTYAAGVPRSADCSMCGVVCCCPDVCKAAIDAQKEKWKRMQMGDSCVSAAMCAPEKEAPFAVVSATERQVAPREMDSSFVQPTRSGFSEEFTHPDFAAAHAPFGDISSPPPRPLS